MFELDLNGSEQLWNPIIFIRKKKYNCVYFYCNKTNEPLKITRIQTTQVSI